MLSVESYVELFAANKCNLELLCNTTGIEHATVFGVRVRPWTKGDQQKMVLGKGVTVEEALKDAYSKAAAGRWEALDFAKRPWDVPRAQVQWQDPETARRSLYSALDSD